ncbi:hypothetical protein KZP23_01910 [Echinicola marina]|uniref:Uncharacterized protein n=1 Tax=Echinicola vietnamensis (strain DSM 17526 / LMG 23754 / KMM 6221) TaxID=926556 RepID=L0FVI4_ECHVK|nr:MULTISPECIES: hypothetical protein [Echinicola]AGA76675.1 hypothetical protein Echvi_0386 [Echinicola vietnamensis DSM 17526]UCS93816.1 hypothetical protein KZP23_01910 [Echinicola marina]
MINIQNDELIRELIRQDLKHNQLVKGLDNLDLDAGHRHHLGIMDLVKRLMEVPEHLENDFLDTYMGYMDRCLDYPISSLGEELRVLAEEGYEGLNKLFYLKSQSENDQ